VACPGFPFALCVAAVCFVSFSSVAPVVMLCFVFLFVVWGCCSFLSQGSVLVLLFCLASWPWVPLTSVDFGRLWSVVSECFPDLVFVLTHGVAHDVSSSVSSFLSYSPSIGLGTPEWADG
jgi:hypothetical protein